MWIFSLSTFYLPCSHATRHLICMQAEARASKTHSLSLSLAASMHRVGFADVCPDRLPAETLLMPACWLWVFHSLLWNKSCRHLSHPVARPECLGAHTDKQARRLKMHTLSAHVPRGNTHICAHSRHRLMNVNLLNSPRPVRSSWLLQFCLSCSACVNSNPLMSGGTRRLMLGVCYMFTQILFILKKDFSGWEKSRGQKNLFAWFLCNYWETQQWTFGLFCVCVLPYFEIMTQHLWKKIMIVTLLKRLRILVLESLWTQKRKGLAAVKKQIITTL